MEKRGGGRGGRVERGGVEEEKDEHDSMCSLCDSSHWMADPSVGSNQRQQTQNKHSCHRKTGFYRINAPWQLSISWKRKRRRRCRIWWRQGRTDGWRLLHHWCYGTAVNRKEREEEIGMTVGKEGRGERWGDKDKVSVTVRQRRKWWKTKRERERKLQSGESQWNTVMLLSLSAREKWERQRGSDVFVRQCQFSALTAANTLVLLCKQAITGEKYTPTKCREGRHRIKKTFLCHFCGFLTRSPSKEHHFLANGHFFHNVRFVVCSHSESMTGKLSFRHKCFKGFLRSVDKQETKTKLYFVELLTIWRPAGGPNQLSVFYR